MNKEQLSVILNDHSKWLKNESEGKRADLSGLDLSGMDLSNRNLTRAIFCKSILSFVNFSNANLSFVDFSGADLYEANLSNSKLKGSIFIGSDLYAANLQSSDLTCATLSKADIRYANFKDANLLTTYLDGIVCSHTDIFSFVLGKFTAYAFMYKDEVVIKIGCAQLSASEWLSQRGEEIAKANNYSRRDIQNHRVIINAITEMMKEDKIK